jgi:hypothetical protein
MSETGWVSDSYYARFRNFPPVLYWRGTVKEFQALMMQALERGMPLTADELMKVQGHNPPAPEAKGSEATAFGVSERTRGGN